MAWCLVKLRDNFIFTFYRCVHRKLRLCVLMSCHQETRKGLYMKIFNRTSDNTCYYSVQNILETLSHNFTCYLVLVSSIKVKAQIEGV
jgi:hypothetical protein